MKKDYLKTSGKLGEPGIYVMFSGTGSNVETTRELASVAKEAGLNVYTPPWVNVEGATPVSPDVLTDENVIGVFSRSGWGTGWQVQNLALPWYVTPYEKGDDPEIYFNNKTIEALKMGRVLTDADITPKKLVEMTTEFSTGVAAVNAKLKDEFGTLNGIDFMADEIAKDFVGRMGK
jgi:hypothetical protein